ncbi:hypothetical protein GE115_06530 [Agromyces sp. CFH 90414]|uniref:DUF6194 domain-containing protein n=1 Tax=Agromyces agglutinans TaxID=2662258 RepID=A0A6I2FEN5_9MICO|nr:DUF6194 family protein [Agromyces agglutinans]MRG59528.1 hypothetical protein [Agromyces agglutinans]
MEMQQIIDAVQGFDGALVVVPEEGGPFPELAWGDAFFFFAPDGVMPERTQPYGTIITKDYPGDEASRLDAPDRFRVNIHVGRDAARRLAASGADPAEPDVVVLHPVYGAQGWVSVVGPGERTGDLVLALLREAHEAARARATRRASSADRPGRPA